MTTHDHEGGNATQALEITVLATVAPIRRGETAAASKITHIYPVGIARRHGANAVLRQRNVL